VCVHGGSLRAQESALEPSEATPLAAPSAAACGSDRDPRACDGFSVALRARFGVATAPFYGKAFPETRGHGFVFTLSVGYRFGAGTLLAVQMPLALMSVAQPAGAYLDHTTWGNANLVALHQLELWSRGSWRLRGVGGGSLALPVAQRGPADSELGARALRLASAIDALRHQELYTAGALPVALTAGVSLEHGPLSLAANLRVPVFFRLSRTGWPRDADTRAVSTTPVLHVGARYGLASWLELALAADTVFDGRAPATPVHADRRVQFALLPALQFHLPRGVLIRTDFVLPIAGPLGAHVYAGGLQVGFQH
jgi:hypothetical protein